MALTDVDEQRFKDFGTTLKDCLAYLERQREQKPECPDDFEDVAREFRGRCLPPIEPISDELVEIIKDEFEGFRTLLKKKGIDYEPQRGYWEGFARLFDSSAREYVKEQKPAWSEEDETKLNDVIHLIEKHCGLVESIRNHYVKFLKSLRPSWKPTQEQMNELWSAISYIELPGSNYLGVPELLESLYEQLEKL